jgi:hypothetical protein
VIENDNSMTILGLKKSVEPVLPILGELQEKFFLVTTMCDAPHMQYASKNKDG